MAKIIFAFYPFHPGPGTQGTRLQKLSCKTQGGWGLRHPLPLPHPTGRNPRHQGREKLSGVSAVRWGIGRLYPFPSKEGRWDFVCWDLWYFYSVLELCRGSPPPPPSSPPPPPALLQPITKQSWDRLSEAEMQAGFLSQENKMSIKCQDNLKGV